MELLLLAVTIVSLLVALFLGAAAWGMWREERLRSAARVAALEAAASADEQPAAEAHIQVVAAARKPAPWSAPPDWRRLPKPHAADDNPAQQLGDAFLGSAVAPANSSRQRGLAIAACVLFAALLTGAYFTIYAGSSRVDAAATDAALSSTSPLELISLRHERQNGALSITGLVRNPAGGQRIEHLAAVVFLFDQQGEFVTSSRAGVDFTQLAPGDESPFVIRVDAPSNVARYRVSFRTDAGIVSHIDRRGQEPMPGGAVRARDLP
jgi:hypothetical protein